jgi:ribosome-binding protein aMBF1 (putative translation factor)
MSLASRQLTCDVVGHILETVKDRKRPLEGGPVGTKFDDWVAAREAVETPGEAELRKRFAAGITLGLQYHDARVTQGLTQRQLSELSGVPQADISRIERGAGNPTEATLERLALALGRKLELLPV